jgi:hypothetical protein
VDERGSVKAQAITSRLDGHIMRSKIRDLVDAELIEEHRRHPIGEHSPNLDVVLSYLRRSPNRDAPRLVLVAADSGGWRIAEWSRVRGDPLTMADGETYGSREEAEHAVFLRRLAQVGIDV